MYDQSKRTENRPHPPLNACRKIADRSDNQGAKWGVSMFGTLSPFESQPARSHFLGPSQFSTGCYPVPTYSGGTT